MKNFLMSALYQQDFLQPATNVNIEFIYEILDICRHVQLCKRLRLLLLHTWLVQLFLVKFGTKVPNPIQFLTQKCSISME